MKKSIRILAAVFAILMVLAVPAAAASYQTYVYDINGSPLHTPDAYTPMQRVDSIYMGLEVAIEDPRDLVVDNDGNVYIADQKTNRIVVLDQFYKLKFEISKFVNENGVDDELNAPQGVFVSERSVYVKDKDGNNIFR